MKLNYPELAIPQVKIKTAEEGGVNHIFDPVRKKFLILTEEEWVRQHFLAFLIRYLGYPRTLIRTESAMTAGKRLKRTDILIYDEQVKPLLLVECKGFRVQIDKQTMEQAIEYNLSLKTKCIILTNGMMHFCYLWDSGDQKYHISENIPDYQKLVALEL